ncbi:MAG: rhodanese-like domain-containing protein [Pseudomonadota bacterium]
MATSYLSRRTILLGGGLMACGTAAGWIAYAQTQPSGKTLTVTEAHQAALENEIVLIDIRRPDEWARTGIGEGAVPIDMRREDFIVALDQATGGERSAPIALICARGVRSKYLTARLSEAGYRHVIDVPEGMMGSFSGPGWLKTGLPVTAYEG